ncbi:MAG TPA: hypothetical protein VNL72_00480 [Gammaproteobacteria bacterium]|nr:hypothetical protein [Gammaproteobacteria bacterium]
MNDELVCWKCGAPLRELPLPLSRYAQCLACRAELHVCRMCRFFEPKWTRGCREPRAEEVMERERANFCDWFTPAPGAWRPAASASADRAREELEKLFGKK